MAATSPNSLHAGGKYRNALPANRPGFMKTLAIMRDMLFSKPRDAKPLKPIPVQPLTRAGLLDAPDQSLFRLGHSTLLLKLGGDFWLTDPVFSQRASPVQWAGPKRFHAPPISIEDLPPIRGIVLSHDHFDHLDRHAVLALDAKTEVFVTPLGVGDRLVEWGVDRSKVRQLDWWQDTEVAGIRFTATPAQHFSGRGLHDGNSTLWCSWVIDTGTLKLFFSGDSGYFSGFKAIGDRFGPFDVAFMETGAYNQQWPDVHMQPEETLQAFLDLRGRTLLPIHNGTFDLSLHTWHEPFDRISALARDAGVAMSTPRMGERVALDAPAAGSPWWLEAE